MMSAMSGDCQSRARFVEARYGTGNMQFLTKK
jgi:hypothetical protein